MATKINPIFFRLTKVDEAKREVWGRATQEIVDKSNEIFDYATSKPFFEKWSQEFSEATDGKSLGNIRSMHGKVAAGKVIAIDFLDDEKAIDIGTKIVDDNEWQKVTEGVHTGFSIGGSYVGKKWKDEATGAKRFTANPAEISLVDSPCVSTAKFFDVIKADGRVEQREFKKGMYGLADFAGLLSSISYMCMDAKYESENEGDNSPLPEALKNWLATGVAIFQQMAVEETTELLETMKVYSQGDLVKAGAKFSKTMKEKMAQFHKVLSEASTNLSTLTKEFAEAGWQDEPEDQDCNSTGKADANPNPEEGLMDNEALTKAMGEILAKDEALTKLNSELSETKEALAKVQTEATEAKETLAKLQAELEVLKAKPIAEPNKGISKNVPISKSADNGGQQENEDSTDPLVLMKRAQLEPRFVR